MQRSNWHPNGFRPDLNPNWRPNPSQWRPGQWHPDFPLYPVPAWNRPARVIVEEPTFYGTCAALNGNVVVNQCLRGTVATATPGGCTCYDPATQWYGCGNTANAVCGTQIPVQPFPYPVSYPILY